MSVENYSYRQSPRRLVWIFFSQALTFIIPNFILHFVGDLKTPAARQAWREKIAILTLYLLSAAFFCFWLEFLSSFFCDPEKVYEYDQVFANNSKMSAINGKAVYWRHLDNDSPMVNWVNGYPHHDLSPNFPKFMMLSRSSSESLYQDSLINTCIYYQNRADQADAWLEYYLATDRGYGYDESRSPALYECPVPDQRNITGSPCFYGSEYTAQFNSLPIKGDIEYDPEVISRHYNSLPTPDNSTKQAYVILDGYVLDVTAYLSGATTIIPLSSTLSSRSFAQDRMFLPLDLTLFLYINLGRDITDYFDGNITENPSLYRNCLIHLFQKGVVPSHISSDCRRINPALWATMGVGLLYFLIKINLVYLSRVSFIQKFLFSSSPEYSSAFILQRSSSYQNLWPYAILMVPCFAESSETLKQTLDSVSRTTYDDSRKLLFFVCDGIITNKQEQKETHSLLLEHLGYSGTDEPIPQPYTSLGQDNKKTNYARVYSGYYESGRNRVPYLVVVKVGQPQEETDFYQEHMTTAPPGNRGKRDSLLLVFSFLERCMNLSNNRITPLEYELFNQCYNVLGMDPRFFKYVMVTDADIQVQSDVVQKLVSRLEQDRNMLAVSGHVRPANPEENLTTMLQIFPAYLAFFSGLAYEACLRSVVSINGGLVMYKVWTENNHIPTKWPKVSDEIIITNPFRDPSRKSSMETVSSASTTATNHRVSSSNKTSYETSETKLCCVHPTVLRGISTPQCDTMHMQNFLLLSEEKIIPIILLKSHPGHRLGFEPDAIGYATLPTNFFVLQGIQSRTLRASFHTQLETQRVSWQLGFGYWLLSTAQLVDMIFSMPIMVYLYSVFIRAINQYGMAYIIIACSFSGLALLHIVLFLLRRQFRYIFWFVLYCLFSLPLFAIWFPLLSVWQSNYAEYWYDTWPTIAGRRARLHGIIDHSKHKNPPSNGGGGAVEKSEKKHDSFEEYPMMMVQRYKHSEFEVAEAKRQHQAAEAALDSNFVGFTGFANDSQVMMLEPPETITTPPMAQLRKGLHSTRYSLDMYNNKNNPFADPFDDGYSSTTRGHSEESEFKRRNQHRPSHSQSSYMTYSSQQVDVPMSYSAKFGIHMTEMTDESTLPSSVNSSGFAKMPVDVVLDNHSQYEEDQDEQQDRASTLSISSNTFSVYTPEEPVAEEKNRFPRHRIVMYHSQQSEEDVSTRKDLHESGRNRAVHNFTLLSSSNVNLRQQFENHATLRNNK